MMKDLLKMERHSAVGKGLRFFHMAFGIDKTYLNLKSQEVEVYFDAQVAHEEFLAPEVWELSSNEEAACIAQQIYAEAKGLT